MAAGPTTLDKQTHHKGHPCECYCCGVEVYPHPLDVDPELHILRGYPVVAVMVDECTGSTCLQPRLFCPECLNPTESKRLDRLFTGMDNRAPSEAAHQ